MGLVTNYGEGALQNKRGRGARAVLTLERKEGGGGEFKPTRSVYRQYVERSLNV